MLKKRLSLKNRGLVPTIQPDPDFSWTCGFHWVLHNVELVMYTKFQKILMTGSRDMLKMLKIFFFQFVTPNILFKNRALQILEPYCTLCSCKKLEKTNKLSLRYLKTDRRTTYALRTPRITLSQIYFNSDSTMRALREFLTLTKIFCPRKSSSSTSLSTSLLMQNITQKII